MPVVTLEPGGKVQLPPEWVSEWRIGDSVEAEQTQGGILLRPRRRLTWDEVFRRKAKPGTAEPRELPDEVSGDDLWL